VQCPHGLQGFLPHLSGHVGGHQHGAEFALSKKALTLVSKKRIKRRVTHYLPHLILQPIKPENATLKRLKYKKP
jgi:hypothetical protein